MCSARLARPLKGLKAETEARCLERAGGPQDRRVTPVGSGEAGTAAMLKRPRSRPEELREFARSVSVPEVLRQARNLIRPGPRTPGT